MFEQNHTHKAVTPDYTCIQKNLHTSDENGPAKDKFTVNREKTKVTHMFSEKDGFAIRIIKIRTK